MKILLQCSNDHLFQADFQCLGDWVIFNKHEIRCPKCNAIGVKVPEEAAAIILQDCIITKI
jgi:hypothetical protein